MALYRYVANANPKDQTSRVKTFSGVLVRGGEPLDLTEQDLHALSAYVLEPVDAPVVTDVTPQAPQTADVTGQTVVADLTNPTPSATPSAPGTTPTQPAQGN